MNSELQSQSQAQSDRSFVGLGLLLTEKVLSTKTKLKQINPTLIYEWDGESVNNQIAGKGTFIVRNSLSNELIYECEVKKWKNGVPQGQIRMKKVNFFTSEELTDYKVKEVQSYQGNTQNLKKNGNGIYTVHEFYSSGKVKKSTIVGEWNYDILVIGVLENELGKRDLNLNKNVEWSKSTKSIALSSDRLQNTNVKPKEEKKEKDTRLFKENTNLLPQPVYKQKYLDPTKFK